MRTLAPQRYLAIDGSGDPNTAPAYRDALETIYPVAFKLKFFSKRDLGRDYGVPPLEALWRSDDMAAFTTSRDTSRWNWTMLSLLPSWITAAHVEGIRDAISGPLGRAAEHRRAGSERLDEGPVVQTLHVRSYDDEAPVLAAMHDGFIPTRGLRMTGRHHAIYLSDARRTAPEKLRTILRQPVARA